MAGEHNNVPMNPCGLCLSYPANWPLVALLGALAVLHVGIAMLADRAAEAQICLFVGSFFAGAALLVGLMHHELVIRPDRGCLCMSRSLGFLRLERKVPFEQVQSVRLTFMPSTSVEKPKIGRAHV